MTNNCPPSLAFLYLPFPRFSPARFPKPWASWRGRGAEFLAAYSREPLYLHLEQRAERPSSRLPPAFPHLREALQRDLFHLKSPLASWLSGASLTWYPSKCTLRKIRETKRELGFKRMPPFSPSWAEHHFVCKRTMTAFSKSCISNSYINVLMISKEYQMKAVMPMHQTPLAT